MNKHRMDWSELLERIDSGLLGARIEVARIRKFSAARQAVNALNETLPAADRVQPRIYHWDEQGQKGRRQKLPRLRHYAAFFGVPLTYFLLGEGAELYENEAREKAKKSRTMLRLDALENPPRIPVAQGKGRRRTGMDIDAEQPQTPNFINQNKELLEPPPSHNQAVRFIPILTASEIKTFIQQRGDLTMWSGPQLPLPDFLRASRRSFAYMIPPNDLSMTAPEGLSLSPSTVVCIDPDQSIQPGKYVLVDIEGYDEPQVRQFIADRPYSPRIGFSLKALNPAFAVISVADPRTCLMLGRVIFFGHSL